MTLRLREVPLTLEEDESLLPAKVGLLLGVDAAELTDFRIVRRGIDARKKPRILRVYSLEFSCADEGALLAGHESLKTLEAVARPELPAVLSPPRRERVLVVGMGPAGLFAAWHLARCGQQVTLVERGRPVEERLRDVRRFWQSGVLDPASNVQFGEGGAGTFSDGKLTTRVNHPWFRLVLETLVACGAPADILVQAKPHVGTDVLRRVLICLRQRLIALGVTLRFETRLTGLELRAGQVTAGVLDGREALPCEHLVLAPGHSARDTYCMLLEEGVALEPKPFAMGVRIEHPAELINTIQYGLPSHPRLPTAEYALTYNDRASGRGVYSFCMCPGGEVVNAASEVGGIVVNGMSDRGRDGAFSNSALVVSVRCSDFDGADPLAGVRFQRRWEEAAFVAGGGAYHAPAQNLLEFLGRGRGSLRSSCRPGVTAADLRQALPPFVSAGLQAALPAFDRRMRGFVTAEATLVGVETRTSAPLRIRRGDDFQSLSHAGLYPVGEGAGYAGGIMSAALDGLRAAETIVQKVSAS